MSYPRKTVAAFTFGIAFAVAITLTAFLRLRPQVVVPELIESPPSSYVVSANDDADVPFRVEQAVIDFAERQSYTTLMLTPHTGEDVPRRVWVWADYNESAPTSAPPIDERDSVPQFAPGDERKCAMQLVPAVMRLREWTSRPQQIEVTGGRRLSVVAECLGCDERPAGKPTFYARFHVTTTKPDDARIEYSRETHNPTNATPVIVQGTDE